MSGFLRQLVNKIINIPKYNFNSVLGESKISSALNPRTKFYSNTATPYEIIDDNRDKNVRDDIIKNVNNQVSASKQGQLFAIVHLAGKQFKVTDGDLLIIEGYWPPTVGDKINLDKVLMLGASDFTLVGRPLIQNGLVNVHATVIEKSLSHTKTNFKKKRRKQYKRINFYRIPQTMLRINKVEFVGELNNPPDVTGLDHVIL